jgi:hypothetical protein
MGFRATRGGGFPADEQDMAIARDNVMDEDGGQPNVIPFVMQSNRNHPFF